MLRWDDVILLNDADGRIEWGLEIWFDAWFDPSGKRREPDLEFSNKVHSLGFGKGIIRTDLGTAPKDALTDLIHLIGHSGGTSIWIGGPEKLLAAKQ
jgi:hypothetical protein